VRISGDTGGVLGPAEQLLSGGAVLPRARARRLLLGLLFTIGLWVLLLAVADAAQAHGPDPIAAPGEPVPVGDAAPGAAVPVLGFETPATMPPAEEAAPPVAVEDAVVTPDPSEGTDPSDGAVTDPPVPEPVTPVVDPVPVEQPVIPPPADTPVTPPAQGGTSTGTRVTDEAAAEQATAQKVPTEKAAAEQAAVEQAAAERAAEKAAAERAAAEEAAAVEQAAAEKAASELAVVNATTATSTATPTVTVKPAPAVVCVAPPVPDAGSKFFGPTVVTDGERRSGAVQERDTGLSSRGGASAAVAVSSQRSAVGPSPAVVADVQDVPVNAPRSVPPMPAPPPMPATPAAPCTTTAASGTHASGSGQHGVSTLPPAVLGPEIAAPSATGVALYWTDVPGQVVGGGDDPGSRPD